MKAAFSNSNYSEEIEMFHILTGCDKDRITWNEKGTIRYNPERVCGPHWRFAYSSDEEMRILKWIFTLFDIEAYAEIMKPKNSNLEEMDFFITVPFEQKLKLQQLFNRQFSPKIFSCSQEDIYEEIAKNCPEKEKAILREIYCGVVIMKRNQSKYDLQNVGAYLMPFRILDNPWNALFENKQITINISFSDQVRSSPLNTPRSYTPLKLGLDFSNSTPPLTPQAMSKTPFHPKK